jgi:hypothetical protein
MTTYRCDRAKASRHNTSLIIRRSQRLTAKTGPVIHVPRPRTEQ